MESPKQRTSNAGRRVEGAGGGEAAAPQQAPGAAPGWRAHIQGAVGPEKGVQVGGQTQQVGGPIGAWGAGMGIAMCIWMRFVGAGLSMLTMDRQWGPCTAPPAGWWGFVPRQGDCRQGTARGVAREAVGSCCGCKESAILATCIMLDVLFPAAHQTHPASGGNCWAHHHTRAATPAKLISPAVSSSLCLDGYKLIRVGHGAEHIGRVDGLARDAAQEGQGGLGSHSELEVLGGPVAFGPLVPAPQVAATQARLSRARIALPSSSQIRQPHTQLT